VSLSSPGVPEFSRAFGACVLLAVSTRVSSPTLVSYEARFVGSGVRYTQGSENPGAEVLEHPGAGVVVRTANGSENPGLR